MGASSKVEDIVGQDLEESWIINAHGYSAYWKNALDIVLEENETNSKAKDVDVKYIPILKANRVEEIQGACCDVKQSDLPMRKSFSARSLVQYSWRLQSLHWK